MMRVVCVCVFEGINIFLSFYRWVLLGKIFFILGFWVDGIVFRVIVESS